MRARSASARLAAARARSLRREGRSPGLVRATPRAAPPTNPRAYGPRAALLRARRPPCSGRPRPARPRAGNRSGHRAAGRSRGASPLRQELAQRHHRPVQYHVEGRHADLEHRCGVVAGALLEDAQADGQGIAGVELGEHFFDPSAGHGQVVLLEPSGFAPIALGGVELALQILGLEEQLALARAELVERDPQRHHAQPRVDPHALPGELSKALDDLDVGVAEGFLGGARAAESRQKHAAVEPRAVAAQDLAERLAVAASSSLAQQPLGLQFGRAAGRDHEAHCTPAVGPCRALRVGRAGRVPNGGQVSSHCAHLEETGGRPRCLRCPVAPTAAPAYEGPMAVRSRICPACGKLNGADEARCYHCGQRLPGPLWQAARELWTGLFGTDFPATKFFVAICLAVFAFSNFGLGTFDLAGRLPLSQTLRWGGLLSGIAFTDPAWPLEPWRWLSAIFLHYGL